MSYFRILFLAPALLLVGGCGEVSTVEKRKENLDALKRQARERLSRVEAVNFSELQAVLPRIRDLKASLADDDFSKAYEYAQRIDALLQTQFVAKSIEFLRIEASDGSLDAKSAILTYMSQQDLGEEELRAFREMIGTLERMAMESSTQERIGLVALTVGFACSCKMGCKGSAAITSVTSILMARLFGVEVPELGSILRNDEE